MEDQTQKSLEKNLEYEEAFDGLVWNKITDVLHISVWVILRIKKTSGGFIYQEIESEKGTYEDLAFTLWQDYGQFKDRILPHMPRQKIYDELEKISLELERNKIPYSFYLPDFTDDLYIGLVVQTHARIMSDGTVL